MRAITSIRAPWHLIRDNEEGGTFLYKGIKHPPITVIASIGGGWDHVSVSTPTNGTPTWQIMAFVHESFFLPTEIAYQYLMPVDKHIDYSKTIGFDVLHLWRPQELEIPTPPWWMV